MLIRVILAGGSGKRLYPFSTEDTPKQYLSFYNEGRSLLRQISDCSLDQNITIIVTSSKDQQHLQSFIDSNTHILYEPYRRDTSVAIQLACLYIKDKFGDEHDVIVLPSDNIIDQEEIKLCLNDTLKHTSDHLITFGIVPTYPSTLYGYIHQGNSCRNNIYEVSGFKEKPDLITATDYLKSGQYLWNSGMYLSKCKYFLSLFDELGYNNNLCQSYYKDKCDEYYEKCKSISFDIDISERCSSLLVRPYCGKWVDVGNWKSVYQGSDSKLLTNGDVKCLNVETGLIFNKTNIPVKVIGLSNIVVVLTNNGLLVSDADQSHLIKDLV